MTAASVGAIVGGSAALMLAVKEKVWPDGAAARPAAPAAPVPLPALAPVLGGGAAKSA